MIGPRPFKVVYEEATGGNAPAQMELGRRYQSGLIDSSIVAQDWEQARVWYEKSASQDYAPAQYALGLLHYHGRSVAQDFTLAALWFGKAANHGEAKGQYMLGIAFYFGRGVAQSFPQAAHWFRMAHTLAEAQNSLGGMYERGEGMPQDLAEAARRYSSLSYPYPARGYLNITVGAYYNLRKMHEEGRGVSQEILRATEKKYAVAARACDGIRKLYEGRQEGEEATALPSSTFDWVLMQFHQGLSCQYGIGCPQDILGAITLFSLVANQDFIPAQLRLGYIYLVGNDLGSFSDYALGAACYLKAANLGNAPAQAMMAHLYMQGRGVPQDKFESINWREKAAQQGHAESQYLLGLGYRGWRKDSVKALYWLTKAARQGHQKAQFTLGFDLEDGKGGTNDLEALNWYEKAAKLGNSNAQRGVERLRKGFGLV